MHGHLHTKTTPDGGDSPEREAEPEKRQKDKEPCHFHRFDLDKARAESTACVHPTRCVEAQKLFMTELKSVITATDLARRGNRLLSL